ncbi:hypothetical protein VB773_01920 [Haloarculaceae archaeon H-GB2-1]|nr:hypothetical protein [Haloarculaceae archaeon H-GB1-1]MEA5388423.1 hypothetical protein [Haloarculaceae archaeon H-GB11]MEA5406459.1 hypothetical protein [Haloarculaceae archaeon H-GB2-1]
MSLLDPEDCTRRSQILDLLSSYRRRLVLSALEDRTPTPLDELAATVTARETDTPRSRVTDEERTRVEVSLLHAHLPRLQAAGLLSYDPSELTVTAADMPLSGEEWLQMPVVDSIADWETEEDPSEFQARS